MYEYLYQYLNQIGLVEDIKSAIPNRKEIIEVIFGNFIKEKLDTEYYIDNIRGYEKKTLIMWKRSV